MSKRRRISSAWPSTIPYLRSSAQTWLANQNHLGAACTFRIGPNLSTNPKSVECHENEKMGFAKFVKEDAAMWVESRGFSGPDRSSKSPSRVEAPAGPAGSGKAYRGLREKGPAGELECRRDICDSNGKTVFLRGSKKRRSEKSEQ